jgi:hypothetical protein
MSPVEIFQQELNVYKKALKLSNEKFAKGIIDAKLHDTHVSNLEPKIAKYTQALRILRFYTDN